MSSAAEKTQRRNAGGRPRTAEIEQREAHILEVASQKFLELGFDGTTMDSVAETAGISKRTLYARYAHKAALFDAVLRDLIDRWLIPIAQVQSDHGDLRESLIALASYLMTFALSSQSIAINRILVAESIRWPQFVRLADEAGRKAAVQSIASILRRHRVGFGSLDLEVAAEQFMCLTLDSGIRRATLNAHVKQDEVEHWISASVDFFLRGITAPLQKKPRK